MGNLDTEKTKTVKISLAEHSHIVLVLTKRLSKEDGTCTRRMGNMFCGPLQKETLGVGEAVDGEGQSFYSKTHSHSGTCNELLVLVVSKKLVNITDIR